MAGAQTGKGGAHPASQIAAGAEFMVCANLIYRKFAPRLMRRGLGSLAINGLAACFAVKTFHRFL